MLRGSVHIKRAYWVLPEKFMSDDSINLVERMVKNRKKLMVGVGFFLLLVTVVIVAPSPNRGSSNGISGQSGGCGPCHGSSPNVDVAVSIGGIPTSYLPGEKYTLTITVSGNPAETNGGFDLSVDKGTFSNPGANAELLSDKEVSHSNSNAKTWVVDWTAPSAGSGTATFSVAGIVVDGDLTSNGDKWNIATYSSSEEFPTVLNKTVMTLDLPEEVNKGDSVVITVTLMDEDGGPLEGFTIEFNRVTTFGILNVGENVTDSQGRTSIIHTISYTPSNGTVQIKAVFNGTPTFESSRITGIIAVESGGHSSNPNDLSYLGMIAIITLIVSAVWVVFGYVLYQLYHIRREGKIR